MNITLFKNSTEHLQNGRAYVDFHISLQNELGHFLNKASER